MEYNKDEALDLLRLMVTTKTVNPPGNEAVLARKLQPILEKEGLEVTLDEFLPNRANMLVRLKGKVAKPELIVTGHLDTVPVGAVEWEHDPFAFDIVDGMVYGRGVDDMKGGDAAALYAMIMLKRNGIVPEHDILFVGTVGEETMDLGSGHFTEQGGMDNCGSLLVCEPSGLEILTAHKGAIWVKVQFFGKTSHGSMPDLGINALLHMTKFIEIIQKQPFDIAPDPNLGMPTLSINMASAGAAPNVVPDHAECTIDFRTIPGQTWEMVKAHLDKALAKAAEGEKDFKYEYAYIDKVLASVACPKGHHIITDLDKAAGRTLNRRQVNFFTDASTMVTRPDLPVVVFGPGESSQAHQPNEHIPLEQFYECISIYYNFMKEYNF